MRGNVRHDRTEVKMEINCNNTIDDERKTKRQRFSFIFMFAYVLVPLVSARARAFNCTRVKKFGLQFIELLFKLLHAHTHTESYYYLCLLSGTCWTQSEWMSLLIDSAQSAIMYFPMVAYSLRALFKIALYWYIVVLIFPRLHSLTIRKKLDYFWHVCVFWLSVSVSSSNILILWTESSSNALSWQELFYVKSVPRNLNEINFKAVNAHFNEQISSLLTHSDDLL